MANTTNFNWETPDDTDLVKDGAAAIRTLGNSIDTSLVDLKGGTTGQVLTKASNTDLDYSWTSVDPLTILDAKGDLISATAADTPARLAVGANDTVLTADSSTSTGLKWATPSSGGMTLISTTTLSGASITLSSIPQTYKDLVLIIRNFKPATDSVEIIMRFNGDSNTRYNTISVTGSDNSFAYNAIYVSDSNDNSVATGLMRIEIPDYANSVTWKMAFLDSLTVNPTTTTNLNWWKRNALYNQTAAISSIYLAPGGGNFTSGEVLFYGVK